MMRFLLICLFALLLYGCSRKSSECIERCAAVEKYLMIYAPETAVIGQIVSVGAFLTEEKRRHLFRGLASAQSIREDDALLQNIRFDIKTSDAFTVLGEGYTEKGFLDRGIQNRFWNLKVNKTGDRAIYISITDQYNRTLGEPELRCIHIGFNLGGFIKDHLVEATTLVLSLIALIFTLIDSFFKIWNFCSNRKILKKQAVLRKRRSLNE